MYPLQLYLFMTRQKPRQLQLLLLGNQYYYLKKLLQPLKSLGVLRLKVKLPPIYGFLKNIQAIWYSLNIANLVL